MGIPREPGPAKYFVALLAAQAAILMDVERDLAAILGDIDDRSEVKPWVESWYYEKEMGAGLLRRFISFAPLSAPDQIARIKLRTQEIERNYRRPLSGGRRVNIDPGYLDVFKVVLASTKNASQRVYLHSGIYAETTLHYNNGAFHGLPHTYPDYVWPETLAFLGRLRSVYLAQLRPCG
jgi:hypothetical protein